MESQRHFFPVEKAASHKKKIIIKVFWRVIFEQRHGAVLKALTKPVLK